ncbi:alkyl sulfatase dimerization domain-containing protein [Nocardia beijingensis]|uniref:alkyl sulfatase dimerization domain-containing protein n=1 Tax=Nocardia beijingensis TaxID=95162 RepID=UPI00082E2675|nr:alkyl sulfatase dimerization domain-containing protein [Nocardia beijingensis]
MTQTQPVPEHTSSTGEAAFLGFALDQMTHLFSRGHTSGAEAEIVTAAPRTYYIRPGVANIGVFETDEGLLMVDTGLAGDGRELLRAVRSISDAPLHTVVYTHGHVDHAFGHWAFLETGETPRVIAHENLIGHFERYMKTPGLNAVINKQMPGGTEGKAWPSEPTDFLWPTETYSDTLELVIGGERFVVRHGKGETDDCSWVWAPRRRVIAAGDLVTGYLPNAGNPRKVQRYAEEWADAAEEMAALIPEVIIPGHGTLVRGVDAIQDELKAISAYLRHIFDHALTGLNAGQLHDDIVESLRIPDHLAAHPRLPAIYDKPEFICRNVIRRYSGWWDGNLANLLPAPKRDRAIEYATLAGGVDKLVERVRELTETNIRLACHLAETAYHADPDNRVVQDCYGEVFGRRAEIEPALMAKVIFAEAYQRVEARRANVGEA